MSGPVVNLAAKGQKIAAVDAMTRALGRHLNEIAKLFDDPYITLIVRAQGQALIQTNDTTEAAVRALEEHKGPNEPTREKDLREALDLALHELGRVGGATPLLMAMANILVGDTASVPEARALIDRARAEIASGNKTTLQ